MFQKLVSLMGRPMPYEKSAARFWEDEHISGEMLKSHLDPLSDGATNNHAFVGKSVDWIAGTAPVSEYASLLDLGCGPGIYAERFALAGYRVTGMDFSERSINYARASAREKGLPIRYLFGDYLKLDAREQYPLATMINFDFGALSTENRTLLLSRVWAALEPHGLFLFDVFTPRAFSSFEEGRSWEFEPGGFWSAKPYLSLNTRYRYEEERAFLRQHIVMTEQAVNCYNLWDHAFTEAELTQALREAGFTVRGLYGDIAGTCYSPEGKGMCVVAQKDAL